MGGTKIYTGGNWGPNCPAGCGNDWNNFFWDADYYSAGLPNPDGSSDYYPAPESVFRTSTPFIAPSVVTDPTGNLKSKVLATAGASKPFRDAVDTRIVNDVINLTGSNLTIGAGGPWPTLTGGAPPTDTDRDGMPDAWETSHGLSANNISDGALVSSNGYTHVENYLNELAGDIIPGNPYGSTPTPTPLAGDLNGDRIINSIDFSIMNGAWLTNNATSDLNKDGIVNSLDFSLMNSNWLKTY